MINSDEFVRHLQRRGVSLFTGVPDSLLKSLCDSIEDLDPLYRVTATNEGTAVALAIGHHLATGSIPCIYMQNSGLTNALNPLISLADASVSSIPLLLVIGWRGKPGMPDEPQHRMQGAITLKQLELINIPTKVINISSWKQDLDELLAMAKDRQGAVACLITKDLFKENQYSKNTVALDSRILNRSIALETILNFSEPSDLIISTTGYTSRELASLRMVRREQPKDFLVVGGMGHASAIALGVARSCPERMVICLDGDGALLMHLGALAMIGESKVSNLIHIILNNGCHESVGGQRLAVSQDSYTEIACELGYADCSDVSSTQSLQDALCNIRKKCSKGASFINVAIHPGLLGELPRPDLSPLDQKEAFITHVRWPVK